MLVFMALVRPAVRLLRGSAAAVLRGFDVPVTERAQVHSAEELKLIATSARRMGLLPKFQETLIHRALELDDVPTREIMTPRQKIFSLPSNMPLDEALAAILARNFSRVPVYDESRGPEHIVGAVYARDLARLFFSRSAAHRIQSQPDQPHRLGAPEPALSLTRSLASEAWESRTPISAPTRPATLFPDLRLAQVMRDILVVPETKSVLDLLRDFQQRRRHLAIAVDEYGSTVGLVTAEDAIEQIAGEFEDEFDSPTVPVLASAAGALLMDGGVNLRDLETQMQWTLPREGGVETLAGFLLMRFGHIPEPGESIVYEGRRLTVVEMDARRISKIRVEPIEAPAAI
jgi:CBS domain containing-hemolysin-like protein